MPTHSMLSDDEYSLLLACQKSQRNQLAAQIDYGARKYRRNIVVSTLLWSSIPQNSSQPTRSYLDFVCDLSDSVPHNWTVDSVPASAGPIESTRREHYHSHENYQTSENSRVFICFYFSCFLFIELARVIWLLTLQNLFRYRASIRFYWIRF